MILIDSDRQVGVLKCDIHLRPGSRLRHILYKHIILRTLASFLKEDFLFYKIC